MEDAELADEIIKRLNALIEAPGVKTALRDLCMLGRVNVPEEISEHPSIQVFENEDGKASLGFLGMLNGIVGAIREGKLDGWGYIAAVYNKPKEDSPQEEFELSCFQRTDRPVP